MIHNIDFFNSKMATLEDIPVDIWHVILQDNEYKLVHNPHYARREACTN